MDLYNGKPLWAEDKPDSPFTRSEMLNHYDVIIVGGGISGALSAYSLAAEGLSIAVIDRGAMGGGSTSANMGLLQYSSDVMLHELIEQIGRDKAIRFYKLCEQALTQLQEIAGKLDTPADFIRRNSLYFASEQSHVAPLKKEYDTLAAHGFKVDYWTEGDLRSYYPFSKPAALITYGDAEVNPVRFSRGILHQLHPHPVHVFEHVRVTGIEEAVHRLRVHTSVGPFHCSQVIFATGYDAAPGLMRTRVNLTRSYAIATEPVDDLSCWKDRVLIWETRRPYVYMRTTPDGRIIAGGLDEDTPGTKHSEASLRKQAETIRRKVLQLFPLPSLKTAFAWAGVFGQSVDSLPFIGRHPVKERIYYLLSYGGNGTVYGMVGAHILRDLILGRSNPDADIVKLARDADSTEEL
ncbi:FAD-binding oxidoreductase [Paenibacillus sp. YPG26]|uniref:NAD(P)/FAD-dependent oxidoreductase n=1 Tax=Paenibacillus sp. YPG26 TaxID=2878915 RepID=UPI002041DF50|nr:FAD-binding oxidoreductase [Paenibacillus sp. YPG26]USB33106.1 FAD-binding oxidoreductase [Paenibacillus sp. YPG26]